MKTKTFDKHLDTFLADAAAFGAACLELRTAILADESADQQMVNKAVDALQARAAELGRPIAKLLEGVTDAAIGLE